MRPFLGETLLSFIDRTICGEYKIVKNCKNFAEDCPNLNPFEPSYVVSMNHSFIKSIIHDSND